MSQQPVSSSADAGGLAWWQRPMRIAAQQLESVGDPLAVLDAWQAEDFSVEQLLHVSADGWLGIYDARKRDEIARYVAEAHARGIHIIYYFGGHWLTEAMATAHPDWVTRLADGSPLRPLALTKEPQQNYYGCPNTGYLAWAAALMREMAGVGADGVFLDGAMFPDGTCYCACCRQAFAARTGHALLAAREDPALFPAIEAFRMDSIANYLAGMRAALRAVNPQGILYVNGEGVSGRYRQWGYGTRRMAEYQDILGAEGGFVYYGPARETELWKASATAKLLETQAEGKPCVIFIAGDHKCWNWYHLTGPETTLLYAETIANGASPWYGLHSNRLELHDTPGPRAARRMNAFMKTHEAYLTQTTSAAQVALFFSTDTNAVYETREAATDFYAAQERSGTQFFGNFTASWHGAYEALYRSHVPFDIIDEPAPFTPERYPLLLLPTAACMSDETAQRLRDYVHAGGHLLATFDTSAFYPDGTRREQPALADLFGIRTDFTVHDMGRASYLSVTDAAHPLCRGLTQTLLPACRYALEVEATDAEVLASFHQPVPTQYRPLTPLLCPALLTRRYGRGAVVYLPGTFFESYADDRICDYRTLVANAVRWLAPQRVECPNMPPAVEVILRRQPGRLLLHLINMSGDMNRPLEWIAPLRELHLRHRGALTSARALMSGVTLPLAQDGEFTTFTLPELGDYEVIVLE